MKKTMNIHILGLLLCSSMLYFNLAFTQGNNNTISLAPKYWEQNGAVYDLPTDGPNPGMYEDYDGSPSDFTHSAIQDENGELLFFVVDGGIYDKDGYQIEHLTFSDYGQIRQVGFSETLIVPDPVDCNKYYIFSSGSNDLDNFSSSEWIPHYVKIDMEEENAYHQGRYGAIDQTMSLPLSLESSTITPGFWVDGSELKKLRYCNFSAVYPSCKKEVLVYMTVPWGVFQYRIDENGLTYQTKLLFDNPYFDGPAIRAEMESIVLPNGNHRIASVYRMGNTATESRMGVFFADFSPNGNLISNSEELVEITWGFTADQPFINGIEFSENGEYLYVTHNTTTAYPNAIEYLDYNNLSNGLTPLAVSNASDFQYSQIETNENGQLIFATSNRIATLSNSNSPNVSNWNNNFQSLGAFTYPINNFDGVMMGGGVDSYMIPKQIKQVSYSDYFAKLGCSSGLGDITYSGTWSPGEGNNPFNSSTGEVYIDFDLVIPKGSQLTIEDMTFHFSSTASITVEKGDATEKGASLILNGTTLTADTRCDEEVMWPGILVEGHSNQNQTPLSNTQQGQINVIGNSRIEHAMTGIHGLDGGIVRVSNSIFCNNRVGINIPQYFSPNQQDNQSYIRLSEFITDGFLNNTSVNPESHLILINNEGVRIQGCKFKNETPGLYPILLEGVGVMSSGSRYTVEPRCLSLVYPCTSWQETEFENLSFGIYSLGGSHYTPITVNQSKFIWNLFGIFIVGVNDAEITENTIQVRHTMNVLGLYNTGVTMSNCTNYQIEENTIFASTPHNAISLGILVSNSGEDPNEIYKNTFELLNIGVGTQDINGTVYNVGGYNPIIDGLEIKCNEFTDSYVTDIGMLSGRIKYLQGDCIPSSNYPLSTQAPAGNLFSHTGNNFQSDYAANPGVQEIRYAHHADAMTTPIDYNGSYISLDYCASIVDPVYFDGNSCPSNISSGGGSGGSSGFSTEEFSSFFQNQSEEYDAAIHGLQLRIDNGNTNAIMSLMQEKEYDMANELMLEASPYLSDEVLLSIVDSDMAHNAIEKILELNSPLTSEVKEKLLLHENSESFSQFIQVNSSDYSERDLLFFEISRLRHDKSMLKNQLIRRIWNDTLIENKRDQIIELVENENDISSLIYLGNIYLQANYFDKFDEVQNKINQLYPGHPELRLMEFSKQITLGLDSLEKVNLTDEINSLIAIEKDPYIKSKLEALELTLNFRVEPIDLLELIEFYPPSKLESSKEDKDDLVEDRFRIYPNPNPGDKLNLEFDGKHNDLFKVLIVNSSGQKIFESQWDNKNNSLAIEGIDKGLYLVCLLNQSGEVIDRKKLLISK